jgi:hypothetical protein
MTACRHEDDSPETQPPSEREVRLRRVAKMVEDAIAVLDELKMTSTAARASMVLDAIEAELDDYL